MSNNTSQEEAYATNEKVEEVGVNISEVDQVSSTITPLGVKPIKLDGKDVDDAMKYVDGLENFELDLSFEKKLVRKIDYLLIPVMALLAMCQLMDKSTNSYASIMGLRTDLHMTGSEYSWVGSTFYLGYLVSEMPAGMLLQRFPLAKTLSSAIIIWSIVLMCHAACHSSAPFLVCRVILGMFECFLNPAYVLLTSQWWRQREQFKRSCYWWGTQGFLAAVLGSCIAYGLTVHRAGSYSFATWRLLYIITGVITLSFGIFSMFYLPDSPAKAWFLNAKEKKYALKRAQDNQQGFGNHHFKSEQFIEALTDITSWLFFIYGLSYSIPNGGFSNFGSILLNTDFGFSTQDSLLMAMSGGSIDLFAPIILTIMNKYIFKRKRLISCAFANTLVVIGMCLFNFTSNRGSKLAGYLSFYIATATSAGMLSILASNVAGYTKKATANAMFLIGYCAGNVIGPQTFRSKQAPNYVGAKIAMLVSFIVGTLDLLLMYYIYDRRNKSKEEEKNRLGSNYRVSENVAFADLTDKQNPEFRYSL